MVYLIGSRTRPTCKIGLTLREEVERLRELRAAYGNDLVVLATLPGARKEEKRLHNLFSEKHVSGEWFQMCPEICEVFGFDLYAPSRLWAVHLKYVDKKGHTTCYNSIMCSAFAPTEQEAIVDAKRQAAAEVDPPTGLCVEQMAIYFADEEIQKAYTLLLESALAASVKSTTHPNKTYQMKNANFLVEQTSTGFSAYSEELGIVATGRTLALLEKDARDGVEGQCEVTGENPKDFILTFITAIKSHFAAE